MSASRWRGRRVLVTGAAGFIGANLVRRLLEEHAAVHALVRPQTALARLEDVLPALALHRADVADGPGLAAAARAAEPQVIVHLAADGVLKRGAEATALFTTNVLGTLSLLQATAPLPYERFVHVGGSSEYGPRLTPLHETEWLEPVTAYGASKAAATLAARQFARAYGRPLVILRPFSVYGPWEASGRLIPTAIAAALGGCELPLTPPGLRRDLVFVEDVVEACLAAAERPLPPGEVVNVGTGEQWANEEVAALVASVCGRPLRTRPGSYRPHPSDTGHWVADVCKAQALLGWKARHSLRAGLEKTVAWWATRLSTVGAR